MPPWTLPAMACALTVECLIWRHRPVVIDGMRYRRCPTKGTIALVLVGWWAYDAKRLFGLTYRWVIHPAVAGPGIGPNVQVRLAHRRAKALRAATGHVASPADALALGAAAHRIEQGTPALPPPPVAPPTAAPVELVWVYDRELGVTRQEPIREVTS